MSFISFEFLIFVAGLTALYYIVPMGLRAPLLLIASAVFYAMADARYLAFLGISILSCYAAGLATKERYQTMLERQQAVKELIECMQVSAESESAAKILQEAGEPPVHGGVTWKDLLVRPQVSMRQVLRERNMEDSYSPDVVEEAEIQIKYAGYLQRQEKAVKEAKQAEEWKIPTERWAAKRRTN